MTRLQDAKNELIEALALLESAASRATTESYDGNAAVSPTQISDQTIAAADLSALVDEINIIEAKLSQAMAMIASLKSGEVRSPKINDGDAK